MVLVLHTRCVNHNNEAHPFDSHHILYDLWDALVGQDQANERVIPSDVQIRFSNLKSIPKREAI